MQVIVLGIIVFLHPKIIVFVFDSIIALQLSLESYFKLLSSTIIFVKLLHPENTFSPNVLTEFGITKLFKPLH